MQKSTQSASNIEHRSPSRSCLTTSHQVVAEIHEDVPPPPNLGRQGIQGGTGDRWSPNSILGSVFGQPAVAVAPPPPVPATRPIRPSSVMEANLVHRVQPSLSAAGAGQRGYRARVVLQAIISKSGTIENLQVLNGHPMLVRAALDAVRQWRYRPYFPERGTRRSGNPDYGEFHPVRWLAGNGGNVRGLVAHCRYNRQDREWHGD